MPDAPMFQTGIVASFRPKRRLLIRCPQHVHDGASVLDGLGVGAETPVVQGAAAINARPSSGTSTSRRVRGSSKVRHKPSTASAAAKPASSSLMLRWATPIASAMRRWRSAQASRLYRMVWGNRMALASPWGTLYSPPTWWQVAVFNPRPPNDA